MRLCFAIAPRVFLRHSLFWMVSRWDSRCISTISRPFSGATASGSRICTSREGLRGRGIGKALLAGLARRCVAEGLGRLEWWVLDWNAPAIATYRALGAKAMEEWTVQRLTGGVA